MDKVQIAFIEKLVKNHSVPLTRLAYYRTRDFELARDLVQETFLLACCKPQKICNHARPYAWLHNVLFKLSLREMARVYHTAERPMIDENMPGEPDVELSMEFYIPSSLNEKDRDLIIMRFDRGMTFAEIAEHLGISETTCRQRISRAVKRCKKLMLE